MKNKRKTFQVENLSCQHCVNRVESALKEIGGVIDVYVKLADHTATVVYDEDCVTVEELKKVVQASGYGLKE